MEIELSDVSGVPEALKPLVQGNKLDLSKLMPAEDLTGLKTALQKERANATAWSKLGEAPEAVQKRIADLEKAAQGTGKGAEEAQAKLDAMKADYEGKLTERDKRFQTMAERIAMADLKAELAKAGVVPEGLELMAAFARQRIQFADDGSAKVLTADGKPMIGSGADHGATLGDLAKELATSIPHLVADAGKGGSGKPPGSNGGTPGKKTMTRVAFDALSQEGRAAAIREGTTVTD
jgi:hypothetical protein